MKTIVINSSIKAEETKLDILFKAPFGSNMLKWYYSPLHEISDVSLKIKDDIFTKGSYQNRKYNLIILVDLYGFPRGDITSFTNVYKPLILLYIEKNVLMKLKEFELSPLDTAVYFMNSQTSAPAFDLRNVPDNAEKNKSKVKKALTEKYDEELKFVFSWKNTEDKASYSWKVKTSLTEDTYIDFTDVFDPIIFSFSASESDFLSHALEIKKPLVDTIDEEFFKNNNKNSESSLDLYKNNLLANMKGGFLVNVISCIVDREDERMALEGFFGVFANVFTCVDKGKLTLEYEEYKPESIEKILNNALKKYRFCSSDENIPVKFYGLDVLWNKRKEIFDSWNEELENAEKTYTSKKGNSDVLNLNNKNNKDQEKLEKLVQKLRGVDATFFETVNRINEKYDPEKIKEETNALIDENFNKHWNRRDKGTESAFSSKVESVLGEQNEVSKAEVPDMILNGVNEEYGKILGFVSDAAQNLTVDRDILNKTKKLSTDYRTLYHKGKWSRIAFLGGIISVVAMALPYANMESYSDAVFGVKAGLIILMFSIFAALYLVSSAIYLGENYKARRGLLEDLKKVEEQSDNNLQNSRNAIISYCGEKMVLAENYELLKREFERRVSKNTQKGAMRNKHKEHLSALIKSIKNFKKTMGIVNNGEVVHEDQNPEVDNDALKREYGTIKIEESCFSENNRKIYSILPLKKTDITDNN